MKKTDKYKIGFVFNDIEIYPKQESTPISTELEYTCIMQELIKNRINPLTDKLTKVIIIRPNMDTTFLSIIEKELFKEYKVPIEVRNGKSITKYLLESNK